MREQTTGLVVTKAITVGAAQQRAFAVFTEEATTWWPLASHHTGEQTPEAVVIEPREGGRWFERAPDGTESDWGRVLAWEPPHRLVLSWQLDAEWHFDPARSSEVEVHFIAQGPETTVVTLEHRGLDSFGDRAVEMHGVFDSANGWGLLLDRLAGAVAR